MQQQHIHKYFFYSNRSGWGYQGVSDKVAAKKQQQQRVKNQLKHQTHRRHLQNWQQNRWNIDIVIKIKQEIIIVLKIIILLKTDLSATIAAERATINYKQMWPK